MITQQTTSGGHVHHTSSPHSSVPARDMMMTTWCVVVGLVVKENRLVLVLRCTGEDIDQRLVLVVQATLSCTQLLCGRCSGTTVDTLVAGVPLLVIVVVLEWWIGHQIRSQWEILFVLLSVPDLIVCLSLSILLLIVKP